MIIIKLKLHTPSIPFCVIILPNIYTVFHWEKRCYVYSVCVCVCVCTEFRMHCITAVLRQVAVSWSCPPCPVSFLQSGKARGQSQGPHLPLTSHACCPDSSFGTLHTTLICAAHATEVFQFLPQAFTCRLNSYPHDDDRGNIQNASCHCVTSL